ncbi:MAG TPA: pilin [Patescibacteria group bacterium]
MRKIVVFLLSLSVFLGMLPLKVQAGTCSGAKTGLNTIIANDTSSHTISANLNSYQVGDKYQFAITSGEGSFGSVWETFSPAFELGLNGNIDDTSLTQTNGSITVSGNIVTWTFDSSKALTNDNFVLGNTDSHYVKLIKYPSTSIVCDLGSYTTSKEVANSAQQSCDLRIWQERDGSQCGASGCMTAGGVITYIEASNLKADDALLNRGSVSFKIGVSGLAGVIDRTVPINNGVAKTELNTNSIGTYTISVQEEPNPLNVGRDLITCPVVSFSTVTTCTDSCSPVTNLLDSSEDGQANFELCNQVTDDDRGACLKCVGGDKTGVDGLWTAIGCIPVNPQGVIKTLIQLGLSIGGGVTLLLILAGAFRLSVSAGDPKQAEEAREQITSAVIGLLFIIFSVTMLRFIGIQFLQIPGFGG